MAAPTVGTVLGATTQGSSNAVTLSNLTASDGDNVYMAVFRSSGSVAGATLEWNGQSLTQIANLTPSGITLQVWELTDVTGATANAVFTPSGTFPVARIIAFTVSSPGTRNTVFTDSATSHGSTESVTVTVNDANSLVLQFAMVDNDTSSTITPDPDASGAVTEASGSFNGGSSGPTGGVWALCSETGGTTSIAADFTMSGPPARSWGIVAFEIEEDTATGITSEGVKLTVYNDIQ